MSYHYHINCDGGCGISDPDWDSVPDDWMQVSRHNSGHAEWHYCPDCWAKMEAALADAGGLRK